MSLEYMIIQRKAGIAADAYHAAWIWHEEGKHLGDSGTLCAVLSQTYEDKLNDLLSCLKKQTSTVENRLRIDRTLESKKWLERDRLALALH